MSELLYHYTDQSGLLDILRSKVLWATRIHYLNDSKEYWHAIDVAKLVILQLMSKSDYKGRKEELSILLDEIESLLAVGTVVASFSERGDALSQWRSYVGSQPGFALGLDQQGLHSLAKARKFKLKPCIYDKEKQRSLVSSIIEKTLENEIKESIVMTDKQNPNTIRILHESGGINASLEKIAPRIKHEAFEDEREWRLFASGRPDMEIKHRPGISMITPYVDFELAKDGKISLLREIVIGPTPHAKLAKYSVQQFVSKSDWIDPKPNIITSKAPYRYW
jgi:hypothetical protein